MKAHDIFKKIRNIFMKIRSRILTEYTIIYLYPTIYKKFSSKPVDEKKVIFIESRLPELSNSFHCIYDTLKNQTEFDVNCHFLRKTFVSDKEYISRCKSLIKDMATAKYIFMDEATHILAKIVLREESNLVQLWHGCGAFKKFGYSVSDGKFGASKRAKNRYPVHTNYTLATVSSPEVIPHFEEAMNLKGKNVVKATGCSRTDIFYNDDHIKKSFDKLYSLFPEAKGKKIILYAPTFRGNVENASAPDELNLNILQQKLTDEYRIIIKHHPLIRVRPEISDNLNGTFAVDFTDKMTIDELICVSDICISDYSSLIFEYSLFEKTMVFFAYDIDEYFDSRGFYYDYDELTPGPVFKTTEEIADYITNLGETSDKTTVSDFRKKFMSACDGKATQRIIDEVFGENYYKYRKTNHVSG